MLSRLPLRKSSREKSRCSRRRRLLFAERLEDRTLLTATVLAYQVHALAPGTNTPITTVQVGQDFDLCR